MKGEKKPLQAKFYGTDKKMDIHTKRKWMNFLASLKDKEYEITEVKKGERIKNAPLPLLPVPCSRKHPRPEFFHTEDNASGTAAL